MKSSIASGVSFLKLKFGLINNLPAFDGIINIQGSLALTPTDTDWFNIVGTSIAFSQLSATTITNYVNFTGNIVWVRAKVTRNVDDANTSVLVINYNH